MQGSLDKVSRSGTEPFVAISSTRASQTLRLARGFDWPFNASANQIAHNAMQHVCHDAAIYTRGKRAQTRVTKYEIAPHVFAHVCNSCRLQHPATVVDERPSRRRSRKDSFAMKTTPTILLIFFLSLHFHSSVFFH